jgi:hypothetical protein
MPWPLSNRENLMLRNMVFKKDCTIDSKALDCTYIAETGIPHHPKAPKKKNLVRATAGKKLHR